MPTILHRLAHWAESEPSAPAQRTKVSGEWKTLTAKEYLERVFHLALFLESKGFGAADTGAIFSYNRPEWVHADLAILLLGGKSAGLYTNSTPKDIHYVLEHTEATLLSVQNKDYFLKVVGTQNENPLPSRIRLILSFDGDTSFSEAAISYEAAIAEGQRIAQKSKKRVADYLAKLDPKAGAFLIYTSGTTGNPKGALLSHDNLTFTSDLAASCWSLPFREGSLFSFLPLCHVAEKLQNIGVGITQRYAVSYCTKFENVAAELPEVQPSLLLCVPRLWEKMMDGVMNKIRRESPSKQKLMRWALEVGSRVNEAKHSGSQPHWKDLLQYPVADRLVLSKIRQALGLANGKVLASGAAALAPHVSKWFWSLGLEILEDYGQTESTGVICMTEAGIDCLGTVGRGVPGIEVKIAEDGEILCRGRNVFVGYLKDPASTESTLDRDGWLHTGDLGELTPQGMIRIRGRKKEIMKTSGGKMVAPVPIEEKLKASEMISQVCMVGDGRKYLAALVTLTEAELAALKDRPEAVSGELVTDATIVSRVKKEIDALNKTLASFEQVKRFAVLSREFSIADGEMTPTMKMKRNVVESRFAHIIDELYKG